MLFLIEDTLRQAKDLNFEQPYEKQAELLEEIIKEVKFSKLSVSLVDLETKDVHLVCAQLSQCSFTSVFELMYSHVYLVSYVS